MDKSIIVLNRRIDNQIGGKQSKIANIRKKSKLSRKKQSRKIAREEIKTKALKPEFDILIPEKYSYGKCGPKFGFCDGNRFCNRDGECGDPKTHKDPVDNPNHKYRLCVGADKICIRKAICTADKNNEIKCRLVFV